MLQIIGWLGCFYLVVKGLQIITDDARQRPDGKTGQQAMAVAFVAWTGAIVFAGWLNLQGTGALETEPSIPDRIELNLE